jgi:hypothetical protein
MPTALPLILPIAGLVASKYIGYGILFPIIGMGLGAWFGSLLDKPNDRNEAPNAIKANVSSTEVHIPIVYGQMYIGGNDVYMATSGPTNEVLWIVQTLSEGECDSILQVQDEEEEYVDQVFLDNKIYTDYGGNVEYTFYNGTASQAYDSNLNTAFPEWTDTLKNCCYILWKLTYNDDYFTKFPLRNVTLKGKKLYDFRDTTTTYSNNPCLCLYDYLTNNRYGMGIDSSKIDTTSWTSAANYCDTKGWAYNGVVKRTQTADDVITAILNVFRGTLVWYDDQFYLRYADTNDESSSMTLTDSHIAQNASGKDMISISQPSQFRRPDVLRVQYIDPDKNYTIDSVMVGDTIGVIQDLNLPGITDRQHASDLGAYYLERFQNNRLITGTFRDDALKLDPHDLVTFSSSALSISSQLMRVLNANVTENGLINLSLAYEQDSLYRTRR